MEKGFVDTIRLRRWDLSGWVLNPKSSIKYEETKRGKRRRKEYNPKTEAETNSIQPQTPELWKRQKKNSSKSSERVALLTP